jgi:hypothetical protein
LRPLFLPQPPTRAHLVTFPFPFYSPFSQHFLSPHPSDRFSSQSSFLKLTRFRGVFPKHDPRFRTKLKEFQFPSFVRLPVSIEGINPDSFETWVRRELTKHTEDDFLPDIVLGFLRGKTLDPQELARALEPVLGDRTVAFVISLWPLVLDAKRNELGIPSVILEESRAAVAKRIGVLSDSSSDEEEREEVRKESDRKLESDEGKKKRRHRHHGRHHRHRRDYSD